MMLSSVLRQRRRVRELAERLARAGRQQARAGRRLARRAGEWAGETDTLAAAAATGYLWASRIDDNRSREEPAAPLRELVAALWLVVGWRRRSAHARELLSSE